MKVKDASLYLRPWQPFRRRVKHKPLRDEVELETCFDDNLSRSLSDGNLVRAPSERFLLSNINQRRSYGTCHVNSNTSHWTSFTDHTVGDGDTLAGLSLRYDITIQDIKLANSLWTNEGLYTGRVLRIPVVETGHTNLDLTASDSVSSSSRKSSTDQSTSRTSTASTASISRASADLVDLSSDGGGCVRSGPPLLGVGVEARLGGGGGEARISAPGDSSSSVNNNTCDTSKPMKPHHQYSNGKQQQHTELGRRASVEELKDFLKKMDMSIAMGKKATSSMVKRTASEDSY
jgi:hypothetical protein